MIDPKALTTYAQHDEDLILLALLHDVTKGFYVDVGANYPVIDSVTKLFYDKGWIGINIEPIKSLAEQLKEARPKDINLQLGAGASKGSAVLREYTDVSGHSTFDTAQKHQHDKTMAHVDYEVEILPLKQILADNDVKHIDFMKIDVEGFEYEVVAGNDWERYRPQVVCIEANHVSKDWRKILHQYAYKLFISDGLNEYYVADEAWHRTVGYAERMIELRFHALKQHQRQSWSQDSKDLKQLTKLVAQYDQVIHTLNVRVQQLEVSERLSLSNRPLLSRLKRAAYGLTIDWLKYLRSEKR
jgi:FkbM family methyltransferase